MEASGDKTRGERLFLTTGCLACHQVGELGRPSLFGGGDLTTVARKRPADFFARWLARILPRSIRHIACRCLSSATKNALIWPLTSRRSPANKPADKATLRQRASSGGVGRELVTAHRCGACHALPEENQSPTNDRPPIRRQQRLVQELSCRRRGNRETSARAIDLNDEQSAAIRTYFARSPARKRGDAA